MAHRHSQNLSPRQVAPTLCWQAQATGQIDLWLQSFDHGWRCLQNSPDSQVWLQYIGWGKTPMAVRISEQKKVVSEKWNWPPISHLPVCCWWFCPCVPQSIRPIVRGAFQHRHLRQLLALVWTHWLCGKRLGWSGSESILVSRRFPPVQPCWMVTLQQQKMMRLIVFRNLGW